MEVPLRDLQKAATATGRVRWIHYVQQHMQKFLNFKWCIPTSPGTHIVGPWVTDNIKLYRDLRTGTQYIGNWASRALFA